LLLVYKIINVDSYVLLFDLLLLFWRFIVLVVLLVKNFLDQVLAASDTNTYFSFEIIHLFILEVILFDGVLILLMLFINVLKLIFIFIIYHEILLLLIIYIIFTFLKIVLMKFAIILNNLLHLMFLTKIMIESCFKIKLTFGNVKINQFQTTHRFQINFEYAFQFPIVRSFKFYLISFHFYFVSYFILSLFLHNFLSRLF
jgi:hypothetical protein